MYIIKNDRLRAEFTSVGAELLSLQDIDGTEYMWQRTDKEFQQTAPLLFPFVSWLQDNTYQYQGKRYELPFLEFAQHKNFTVSEQDENGILFQLKSDAGTKIMYPFDFTFLASYRLEGDTLFVEFTIKNDDVENMYFAFGWHPTFHVPIENNLKFEDYYYDFHEKCTPRKIIRDENKYFGGYEAFPLEDQHILRLNQETVSGVQVIEGTSKHVSIRSDRGKKAVDITYPDMNLLVIFHKKNKDFITVEAWSSSMGRKGIIEDFEKKPDLLSLEAGGVYKNKWIIHCQF